MRRKDHVLHRHLYFVSGMFVPHVYCIICGQITFNPRWPMWKPVKER